MIALSIRSSIFRPINSLFRTFAAPAKKQPPPNAASASFVEQQYNRWRLKPESVHTSWHLYFMSDPYYANGLMVTTEGLPVERPSAGDILLYQGLQSTIRSYQQRGHIVADLDPLGIIQNPAVTNDKLGVSMRATELVYRDYLKPFRAEDMERMFQLPSMTYIGGDQKQMKMKDILARLENIYCNKMGLEYTFMTDQAQVNWIKEQFERPGVLHCTKEQKILTLERLTRATAFEQFLMKKYPSEKRFGLEGCEMLIPALKEIIDTTSSLGVEYVVMGMAHRGRLNVLSNVCRKPLHELLTQFIGLEATDAGSGDVKYHLGTYIERLNRVSNKRIRLALIANPSHLEAVDAVVVGRIKAEQFYMGDSTGDKSMSILIHGDASNAGQGIVYEVLHLSDLPNFQTGGSIHIVCNNQIGFTTDPRFSRSSRYCTDVQKVVDGPIFHVNADDPESVIHVCNVAARYRMKYHRDIVIDLVGYRRMGHNEIDEPMFTQPLMYQKIKKLKTCLELYSEKLVKEGVVSKEQVQEIATSYEKICNEAFDEAAKEKTMKFSSWIDAPWPGFFNGRDQMCAPSTGVPEETLRHIGQKFSSLPDTFKDFKIHKGLERVLEARKKMIEERVADWSLGEAFGFGSLLKEGTHVRLSGQDVERGTFSHRHHIIHHQAIDKLTYCLLCHMYPDQARYSVNNSSLSESAVLGFELGFSMANPNSLVLWEGQFGDFCNNAQVIIDQFIVSGQAKWVRQSGLVMLLPHAMEGMGPEHSSCRPERFLQMCDDDPDDPGDTCDPGFAHKQLFHTNMIVANCSTPANLFHIFRRQVLLPFRKPLIIATPKSLLRLPACRSSFDDMLEGTEFRRVLPDPTEVCGAKQLLFCTGKTYYDLVEAHKTRGKDSEVAICRLEQICPFPYDLVQKELERFPEAKVGWAQEEHKNQGWWCYVQPRLRTIAGARSIEYFGRKCAAAPSTGSKFQHYAEVEAYYCSMFGPAPPKPKEEPKKADPKAGGADAAKKAAGPSEKKPEPAAEKKPEPPEKK